MIERFLTYQYIKDYDDVGICVAAPRRPTIRQAYGPSLYSFFNTDADQRDIWKCEEEATAIFKMEYMTLTQITKVLLLNARMYALADRFNLTALKQLAVEKLMSKERYFRYCNLDHFLGTLRAITAPDDIDLLYRVFSRCVDN